LVVLNKRDLLDDAGLNRARTAIASALPRNVKVLTTSDGKIDQRLLLGLGIATENDIANRPTRHDAEGEHDHDDFDSFVVPLDELADPATLVARIVSLAERFEVLRVKGFAAVANKPLRLLVQAVGARVTCQFDRPWGAAEHRQGRLVVIGLKGLDRAAVTAALRA
jgi:cobalamin biosynthesis protein CobW